MPESIAHPRLVCEECVRLRQLPGVTHAYPLDRASVHPLWAIEQYYYDGHVATILMCKECASSHFLRNVDHPDFDSPGETAQWLARVLRPFYVPWTKRFKYYSSTS